MEGTELYQLQPGRQVASQAVASARPELPADPGAPAYAARREQGRAETGGKLIVFAGSTPNIGTTLISFGTAVVLAQTAGRNVAYMCLNLKSSKLHRYLGIEEPGGTLDSLRAVLKSQSLVPAQLRQYCECLKEAAGLHVLFGSMLREQAEFYRPEDIEHLLKVARHTFDVCIVEVNAYWDNAATVCAMLNADARVVVTTEDITHFQEDLGRGLKTIAAMLGIAPSSFELVVNKQEPAGFSVGLKAKDISKETGMRVIGRVGHFADAVSLLNQSNLLALYAGKHPFRCQLDGIADRLTDVCALAKRTMPESSPWLKRLIGANAN